MSVAFGDVYSFSSAGGRSVNQDAYRNVDVAEGACWIVTDGLGGHKGGEVAAHLAADAAAEEFKSQPGAAPEQLLSMIGRAEAAVRQGQVQQDTPEANAMRTTIVLLAAADGAACWGHVGDSRLYRFSNGRLSDVTLDHSVPQSLVRAGEITAAEIRNHPDRNRLLRSLGGHESLKPTVLSQPVPWRAQDAYLLCTDGFWEYVTESEMEFDLAKAESAQSWIQEMLLRLRQRVNGDHDNHTATAIFPAAPAGG